MHELRPADIESVAGALVGALVDVAEDSFGAPVAGTDWTVRRTLDHLADVLVLYSTYVATRATARLKPLRDGRPNANAHELLDDIVYGAAILRRLLDQMDDRERAFHPAGPADRTGWTAMACDELLVHGIDTATTVGVSFEPETTIIEGVIHRLFPWAPTDGAPRDRLLWANGRAALGPHPQLDADWYWWCQPLDDWDGARHRRAVPPAW